jgi:L-lactate dehydrogenase
MATNPVDVTTWVAERCCGDAGAPAGLSNRDDTDRAVPPDRRGVDRPDVTHARLWSVYGDSEVLVWSSLDVAGQPLDAFADAMGRSFTAEDRRRVEDEVVHAAARIIEGKGATYYGVAAVIARAVEVIVRDRRSILTVSATSPAYGCALSLPRLVSGAGIVGELGVSIDEDERARLERSAEVLREYLPLT